MMASLVFNIVSNAQTVPVRVEVIPAVEFSTIMACLGGGGRHEKKGMAWEHFRCELRFTCTQITFDVSSF